MRLPRLVIAAPSTGQGKTTIATGLMAALRAAGHQPSGHKVGPDYIDPGYHALATGRPGRNLDPHLVGEERVVPLLLHGARGADVAVIEGVMGLFDGRLGTDGFASTAHVAMLTGSPVVLVMDVAKLSRTAGAIAAGLAAYDERVEVAGVILNRAGSDANIAEIERAMGLPVLGVVRPDERLATPSRHLGLVTAAESPQAAETVALLGDQLADSLDLTALLDVAATAPDLDAEPWDPAAEMTPVDGRPVIAMAGGRAFTFRYAETEELLRAAGCEVRTFDPLTDTALPAGTAAIYLGGGFPEVHAPALGANLALLHSIREAVVRGVPTVAECAGLLYLARTLDGTPMAAAVPATAAMSERLTMRYPVATAVADSLVTRAGEQVTGHEFHRTITDPVASATPAWSYDGAVTGFAGPSLHAAYLHVHWAGHPQLAQRFAEAAAHALPDPLRHHGDAEATPGLLDLAVNVYDGPRPQWLDDALRGGLEKASAYPDAAPARAALAARWSRAVDEVLPTAGAAEAFSLIARSRPWRRPVVVHPQFTEPHAALEQAGHAVTSVLCAPEDGFALHLDEIPDDADLVVIGNPTNPTGVLHPADSIRSLRRSGRLVVVDEAFMDVVPGETESLLRGDLTGLLVVRSLTKHWSIPGIRAGFVVGDPAVVAGLAHAQVPWSVSSPAIAAMVACCTPDAVAEGTRRAEELVTWRDELEKALADKGIRAVGSSASFVLAQVGEGVHGRLRAAGVAVRRADTFPGLDATWVRIAARPPDATRRLSAALDRIATQEKS